MTYYSGLFIALCLLVGVTAKWLRFFSEKNLILRFIQIHSLIFVTFTQSKKHRLPIISCRQAMYSFFGRSVRGGLFHADELVVLSFYRRFDDLGGDFLCESNDGGIGVMVGCSAFDAFDSFKGLLHSCFAVFAHHAFDL